METSKSKLAAIEAAIDKVSKKQKITTTKTMEQIDWLLGEIEKTKLALSPQTMDVEGVEPPGVPETIFFLNKKVKDRNIVVKVNNEHKEFYAELSKLTKLVEKTFAQNIEQLFINNPNFTKNMTPVVHELILEHFYRTGRTEAADTLCKEANLKSSEKFKTSFSSMNKMVSCLKNKELGPALEWAIQHKQQLLSIGSSLEFKLHKFHFVELLLQKKLEACIDYARKYFTDFGFLQKQEIQRLMGSVLWINNIESSPYANLVNECKIEDLVWDFMQTFCTVMGLSAESPLQTCLSVGFLGIPKQLKAFNLLSQTGMKYEPVEFDELPTGYRYHSVFACPVSKQQSAADNPPMLLTCGHVISLASVTRISRGGNKFKCPYCPQEVQRAKILEVRF